MCITEWIVKIKAFSIFGIVDRAVSSNIYKENLGHQNSNNVPHQ